MSPCNTNAVPGCVRDLEMVSGYSISCSHRGSKFNSQHPPSGSQLSQLQLQASAGTVYMWCTDTQAGNTLIHVKNGIQSCCMGWCCVVPGGRMQRQAQDPGAGCWMWGPGWRGAGSSYTPLRLLLQAQAAGWQGPGPGWRDSPFWG